jgi:hypothetical protein
MDRMPKASAYTVRIRQDEAQRGRYRWDVIEGAKVRDSSFLSFATNREAQADADRYVEKLIVTWRKQT